MGYVFAKHTIINILRTGQIHKPQIFGVFGFRVDQPFFSTLVSLFFIKMTTCGLCICKNHHNQCAGVWPIQKPQMLSVFGCRAGQLFLNLSVRAFSIERQPVDGKLISQRDANASISRLVN